MNLLDYGLLVVIGVLIFFAVRYMIKQKKKGKCIGCSYCDNCSGCSEYKNCHKKEKNEK